MALTQAQQDRLDAATKRLEDAKAYYGRDVHQYDNGVAHIQNCYNNPLESASAASTWFNPTKGPCTGKGGCSLSICKDGVDRLNSIIIPALRASYNELNAAQLNYTKVQDEISKEVTDDPEFISNLEQIKADALVKAEAKRNQFIFWTVLAVVVGGVIFAWIKWGGKAIGVKTA